MLDAVADLLRKKRTNASRNFRLKAFLAGAILMLAAPSLQDRSSERVLASLPELRNWGLLNKLEDSHIHATEAWKLEEGSRDVVVAVIDTGIDPNHPDLKNNLWHDKETGVYGWDFVKNKANPMDEHGHGTHVAGILGAALNAKTGISGVAHKVSIMPVRYYSPENTGADNLRNSVKALNWAIDHGANIINYSGGGPQESDEEYRALRRAQEKGILLVAAAGNEKSNTDDQGKYYYPCAYRQLTNVICVAAVNIKNELLKSSNWGFERVDVAAPGENILSTIPGGKYGYMSGTSQATAFVTGLAALLLSRNRSLAPQEIKEIVRVSADKEASLKNKVHAEGKVNAFKALAEVDRRVASRAIAQKSAQKPMINPAGVASMKKPASAALATPPSAASKRAPMAPAKHSISRAKVSAISK